MSPIVHCAGDSCAEWFGEGGETLAPDGWGSDRVHVAGKQMRTRWFCPKCFLRVQPSAFPGGALSGDQDWEKQPVRECGCPEDGAHKFSCSQAARPPLTDAQLDEAERLEGAATPGPWTQGDGKNAGIHVVMVPGACTALACTQYANDSKNAAFIAAARTLVPALVREVRDLRASLAIQDRVLGELTACDDLAKKMASLSDETFGAVCDERDEARVEVEKLARERDRPSEALALAYEEVEKLRAELADDSDAALHEKHGMHTDETRALSDLLGLRDGKHTVSSTARHARAEIERLRAALAESKKVVDAARELRRDRHAAFITPHRMRLVTEALDNLDAGTKQRLRSPP